MSALAKSKRKASSRNQIDMLGVKDGILMLTHDRYRVVLHVSPINFELKSEEERDAIIDTYESFLNSVGTQLQILVRTREIDMDQYLDGLEAQRGKEAEAVYRDQLSQYGAFVRSLIATNKILSRNFYVIVPIDTDGKADFETIAEQLSLSVDIVVKGLARLGISSRKLADLELLDLFYSFYNPVQSKVQPLSAHALHALNSMYIQKETVQ